MDEPPPYQETSNSSSSSHHNNNNQNNNNQKKKILHMFPIYKVTLGKTTVKELVDMDYEKKDWGTSDAYVVNCYNFCVKGNTVHSIYLTRSNSMPEKWFEYGLSWRSSYNEWLEVLNKYGFSIDGLDFPKVVKYQGHDSFSTSIRCSILMDGINYNMNLGFNYSTGTSVDHNNTLYNLRLECADQ